VKNRTQFPLPVSKYKILFICLLKKSLYNLGMFDENLTVQIKRITILFTEKTSRVEFALHRDPYNSRPETWPGVSLGTNILLFSVNRD
jgi:hypothetical protein